MAQELSPVLEAAKAILAAAGRKGMHVDDIATAAVQQNRNCGLSVEDFKRKVQSALLQNTKLKSKKPTFAQVNHDSGARKGKPKQGWYRLKQERISITPTPPPSVSTSFMGKGGEHAVMSELLFWGYNASIMTVDDGIDIIASKNNLFYYIQVKTATPTAGAKCVFTINKASFKRYNQNNVFYVLVIRHNMDNDFLVVPSPQIKYFIDAGIINDTENLTLTITQDARGTKFTLNGRADATPFYGKFGAILSGGM